MAAVRLIQVSEGVELFGTSETDVRFLYREIFDWGSYSDIELPQAPLVVDCGANVGIFALYMKRVRPAATVIAFEPVPDLVSAVRRNVEHFALTDVEVHQVALGARAEDDVPLRVYPLRPSGSSLLLGDQTMLKELSTGWLSAKLNERMYRGRQITVRVAPLSAYLPPERRIALLKVDVVGAELDVFAGISDEQWTRIDQVIVDAQDTDGQVHAIRSVLHERGFTTSLKQNATEGGAGANFLVCGTRHRSGDEVRPV